ncbi:GyrI-like domain-containing protein [Nocardia asiatica]|uniref:GyrI-like domain-containing protein n=1 Tax=Nocardia asiatica TaxID=209252 RepID=UPI003EE0A67D
MKIDLFRADEHYYGASAQPVVKAFPPYDYVTVEGAGDPDGPVFATAVQTLYRAAYRAKKAAKAAGQDFVVPKLEGLWWVESDAPPLTVPREQWRWKLLIRMPEVVTADMVTGATFERLTEGDAIQALHRGPYATEPETLARMDALMAAEGWRHSGRHHEIYLSDPRRTPDEKKKTILRQPVRRIEGK